ncbi:transcriptional regulator, GntR family [Georgenia satyanarayanai]|uniref:Transcriptional regulator, GntR family n=1 Tax=Georgenia satyanarayanai TaxID=860221 RepID=A0A2Y9ALJ9_9MICO|nr:GntR family transcriptional regulator [Georgenia satyanarayanai]PYF98315.1 GntR family transcriptional regulator [Georgenia satyanarayanai]SSA45200.1 transcriptional regulator, GntR family [Georgenia satyanarayanai]
MGAAPMFDHEGPQPLNVQVSDVIREKIISGEWQPDHRLSSEPELAQEFGISRGTLRRAISTLIREGLLVQARGRGTFVTATALEPSIAQKLTTLSEDFAHRGEEVRTEVLTIDTMRAPAPVSALLDLAKGQDVLHLERVRSSSKGPVAYLVNYVRLDVAPGLESVDFSHQSLFGELESRHGLKISRGRRTFSAVAATAELAQRLGVVKGHPLLYLEQITYLADGRPVEYSDVWIHSERMRVTSLLSR